MSNQIAERTIKSRYIIEVQNGRLDLCGRENSMYQCTVLLRTTTTYFRTSLGL